MNDCIYVVKNEDASYEFELICHFFWVYITLFVYLFMIRAWCYHCKVMLFLCVKKYYCVIWEILSLCIYMLLWVHFFLSVCLQNTDQLSRLWMIQHFCLIIWSNVNDLCFEITSIWKNYVHDLTFLFDYPEECKWLGFLWETVSAQWIRPHKLPTVKYMVRNGGQHPHCLVPQEGLNVVGPLVAWL